MTAQQSAPVVLVDLYDCINPELSHRIADAAMEGQMTITSTFIRRYAVTKSEYVIACELAEASGLSVL